MSVRSLIVVALVGLGACGPRYTQIAVRTGHVRVCATGGDRVPLRFLATAHGVSAKPVDPARLVVMTTVGAIEQGNGALLLPAQPLAMLAHVIVTVRDPDSGLVGRRDLRPSFDCVQSLDLRPGIVSPVRIEAGWLSTDRHGKLALVRVTKDAHVHWFVLGGYGNGLIVDVPGDVEILVEDLEIQRVLLVRTPTGGAFEATIVPSPTKALLYAAGGKPDEGEYDPDFDYNEYGDCDSEADLCESTPETKTERADRGKRSP